MPRCKTCNNKFTPQFSSLQKTCSPECAKEYGKKIVEKERKKSWAKEKKQWSEKLMSLADWKKLAQITFNSYIRKRDELLPCISCKRQNIVKYNAGHYFSQGAFPGLRFDEDNVHKQCEHCNSYLSGNLNRYRKGLIAKIGIERFEALEARCNEVKKYNVNDIKELIVYYKNKIKELK